MYYPLCQTHQERISISNLLLKIKTHNHVRVHDHPIAHEGLLPTKLGRHLDFPVVVLAALLLYMVHA